MAAAALKLARWAAELRPGPADLALADRSLLDTVAVALAARSHRVTRLAATLPEGARWAVAAHVLDFDDLHMPSTAHLNAVCVPMALAVDGGVQRAFGTDAKSLQVGFAVDAGIRAARLAAAGAEADPGAVDAWLSLAGGEPAAVDVAGPAIPAGLAVKMYPCCHALQRPISAISELGGRGLDPAQVSRIVLSTPAATVVPLTHHRPRSGLQGKFSLEYAAAAALLDGYPGFGSFTDDAVRRQVAQRLAGLVETRLEPGGSWLLDGELRVEIHLADGTVLRGSQRFPPGSPARPPSPAQLRAKLADCVRGLDTNPADWTWEGSAATFRRFLPGPPAAD